jgi:hypothetical protein
MSLAGIETWTRIDALHGLDPLRLAALLVRRFRLNSPSRARPDLAALLLERLILDRDANFITDEGHA